MSEFDEYIAHSKLGQKDTADVWRTAKIPQAEIVKAIKKSASIVKRITSSNVEKGIMIRCNSHRNGWWKILSKE